MEHHEMWARVIKGDRDAFEELYREYGPPLRSFVRQYLGDDGAADDVVQETFLALWKRPSAFDPERGTLKQYLFGIGRKQAAQHRRAASVPHQDEAVEAVAGNVGQATILRATLNHLDPDQRALLWLREVEGHSYAELATILDVPVGTIKSRLFAAREALRAVWQGCPKT